jgi:hypothetical protein
MTLEQIYELVRVNKIHFLRILSGNNDKVFQATQNTPAGIIQELSDYAPYFREYKWLEVQAKVRNEDTWTSKDAFTWQLNVDVKKGEDKVGAAVTPVGGISATEHVAMIVAMMEKNNNMLQENMKLQMKMQQNDPTQWLPIIDRVAPMLGFKMAGAPPAEKVATGKLSFSDISKMTDVEKNAKITELWDGAGKVVSADDMLTMLNLLYMYPQMKPGEPGDIMKILNALAAKPELVAMALNYIK